MLGEAVIGTTFGEAIIVVRPPGKHDELLVCKRPQSEALPRSEVVWINEVALMDEDRNWECLFIYEASTRHLMTRNILKNEGGRNKFIHFAQQAPKVDAILIGHA